MPRKSKSPSTALVAEAQEAQEVPVQLSLLDLIQAIGQEHQQAFSALHTALNHARKAGEYLVELRSRTQRGFVGHLRDNAEILGFSKSTAYNYIAIFEGWDKIQSFQSAGKNIESVAHALRVISGASEAEPEEEKLEPNKQTALSNPAPEADSGGFLPGDPVRVIDSPGQKSLIGKEGYVTQVLPNGNPLLRLTGEKYEVSLPAECCELIKNLRAAPSEPAPQPEPAKPEENWPLPYRQRVKLIGAPEEYKYWQGLIGTEGYVVKCSLQKDGTWTITAKLDGEQCPTALPENCWMELDYQPAPMTKTDTAYVEASEWSGEPVAPAGKTTVLMARQGSDEHYTPKKLWEPGLIAWERERYSLDPASNSHDNPNVPADLVYTIEDDGLAHPWSAELLWCNPPFSRITDFVDKLFEELEAERVKHAIWLAKCDCRTNWFEMLCSVCSAFCLVHESVTFGNAENSSFFGVVLFYFGDNPILFQQSHRHLGTVAQVMPPL